MHVTYAYFRRSNYLHYSVRCIYLLTKTINEIFFQMVPSFQQVAKEKEQTVFLIFQLRILTFYSQGNII